MSAAMGGNAAELAKTLVKALVEHPDEVHVHPLVDEKAIRLTLTVHPDDVRHVIGRQGRTIQAIRTVVSAAAAQPGKRVFVEVGNTEKAVK